jgi:hypothetical protein
MGKDKNKHKDKHDKNEPDPKELKKLYDAYVKSKQEEEDAADQYTEAEQKYYEYKEGADAYAQRKDIEDKIKALSYQKSASLTISPTEIRNIKLQALYDAMIESRDHESNAPSLVEDATRKYYTFKNGSEGYDEYQLIQYKKDAIEMKAKMLAQHEKQMKEINESTHFLKSQELYLKNLSEVTAALMKKVKEKIGQVRKDGINTNYRKTYYAEMAEQNLSIWIVVCQCILLAFVMTIGLEYRKVINNPIIWGTMLAIIVFIFSLNFIISLLVKIPTSLSVYTEWGHDPNEPKLYWLIFIPVGLLTLYVLLLFLSN